MLRYEENLKAILEAGKRLQKIRLFKEKEQK